MRGDAHRRQAGGREIDRDLAYGLDGIAVHRDVVLGRDGGQLGDRHDRADLVVRPHDADERDVCGSVAGLQGRAQRLGCHGSLGVDRQPGHLGIFMVDQPLHGVENGVVLDGSGDDPAPRRLSIAASPVDALDGEVVALGATGGEDHLRRTATQQLGQRLARLLHPPTRQPAGTMQRGRVADGGQRSGHRLDGSGVHRGGGGVIEIDRPA